jgi:hypothetical protein
MLKNVLLYGLYVVVLTICMLFNIRTKCWTIYGVVILRSICLYVCYWLICCVSTFFIYGSNFTCPNYVQCIQITDNNIYDFYLFYQILLSPRTSKTDKIGFAKNRSSKPVKLVDFLVFSIYLFSSKASPIWILYRFDPVFNAVSIFECPDPVFGAVSMFECLVATWKWRVRTLTVPALWMSVLESCSRRTHFWGLAGRTARDVQRFRAFQMDLHRVCCGACLCGCAARF